MRTVGWDMAGLTGELLREVRARGLSDGTADGYASACGMLLRLAGELGATEWSPELSDRLAARLGELRDGGEVGTGAYRARMRALRLLSSLALTGEADFSRAPVRATRYRLSDDAEGISEQVLDQAGVGDGARRYLRPPVRHLLWYASERGVAPLEIDDALVMEYLAEEVPRTNPGSAGRTMRAVRMATEWLRSNGGAVLRDYSRLCRPRRSSRIVPAFSESEIGAIVGAIDDATPKGMRDRAIVLLAYCTGLRGSDVMSLRLDEIDWRNQRLTTNQSKTHEAITCVLNGETMNALADYVLKARPDSDAHEVFLSTVPPHGPMGASWLSGWLNGVCEAAGVERLPGRSFHSLRRAFETTLVSGGVEVETASRMMGHRSLESDKPYITFDAARVSEVSMGFDDVPIRFGRYAGTGGGGGS